MPLIQPGYMSHQHNLLICHSNGHVPAADLCVAVVTVCGEKDLGHIFDAVQEHRQVGLRWIKVKG